MNYRHGFHAGNFADVLKHAALVALLKQLTAKDKPLVYLETHAGAGRYLLNGSGAGEAGRTAEYTAGILPLLKARRVGEVLLPYLNLVRQFNGMPEHPLTIYPGSPLLAAAATRETDQLELCELQPEEAARLDAEFRGDGRVRVHQRDGYAALKALLPPTPRRGMVLIDPPFERLDEAEAIVDALKEALARWSLGVYVVWYPIKRRADVQPLLRGLAQLRAERLLVAELCVHSDDTALRLNGSGLAILNPPYRFDRTLALLLPELFKLLGQSRYGRHELRWLKGGPG
jgi:23S rRNA (adenine2030-N6)-methyltransferase